MRKIIVVILATFGVCTIFYHFAPVMSNTLVAHDWPLTWQHVMAIGGLVVNSWLAHK